MILTKSRWMALLPALLLPGCEKVHTAEATGAAAGGVAVVEADLPEVVSFNEHVQPILSEYCYHCHGPDSGTRKPKDQPLRLDRPEDAFALRESLGKAAIVKGDASASKIIELMHSADPDTVMPPPESHKTMKAREIALIAKWIDQGAVYEPHWSLAPVKRPEVPSEGAEWSDNPIDRFVYARMAQAGLKPNPPEDVRRFHRRMTLDTTGLPPKPEETDAFVEAMAKDPKGAVDREAERLLATAASAEHFARHWLDAARYADTHGIHIDNLRSIWPYRDWVIRAFQENMPWDQFTIEQMAGDLMPNRTLDQQVASGFNRCLATTGEGGAIADEYLAIYATDQVSTTSAIWLGLTTGCAACHDHKFDPISTKEFYQLTAFFRNTTMSALDGNNAEHPPAIFVPLPEDRTEWTRLAGELAGLESQMAARRKEARSDFGTWQASAVIEAPRDIDSTLSLHLPLTEESGSIHGTVDGRPMEWKASPRRIEGPVGMGMIIHESPVELGDFASFSRGDQVSYGGFIRVEGTPTGSVIARMDPKNAYRGWDLYLAEGKPGAHVIDQWDKSATKLISPKALEPGKWHHVAILFDGKKSGHQAVSVWVNGERVATGGDPNSVGGNIETSVPLTIGARHGGESKLNGVVALQDFRFYRRLLSPAEIKHLAESSQLRGILAMAPEKRSKVQDETLYQYFLTRVDAKAQELTQRIDKVKSGQSAIRSRGSMSLVMEEKKDSEPFAHVLTRGVYSNLGEKVTAGTPAVLPPMPEGAPKNRLGLAKWLVDPANPLPARVTMNRAWYYIFGAGIVETTNDFGIMGARPSHPKLLDWLASEFVVKGWNHRAMIQLMVTSATYRQSAVVSPEKLEADPANILLARGPRVRLDAEQIRDLALAASGALSSKVGGPPVRPYQPDGIWEAVAMPQSNTRTYRQDSGESLYRRSLYTFWKRTAAPPSMEILNAPSREVTCVRRERTNTPLQALLLLNDPQFIESSRILATKAIEAEKDEDGRIRFITRRLLDRDLGGSEQSLVKESVKKIRERYRSQQEEARLLIATGETPPPANMDPVELATWTLVASQIFNLDETITR